MRDALLALLEEAPLQQITGAMVAARAGVGYATYFRRYHDVRDLLFDTVATLVEQLTEAMMPALHAGEVERAATLLTRFVADHRRTCLALLAGAGEEVRGTLMRRVIEQVAALPVPAPAWLPPRLAVRFAVAGTIEILDWWLQEAPDETPEAVAMMVGRLILVPAASAGTGRQQMPPA